MCVVSDMTVTDRDILSAAYCSPAVDEKEIWEESSCDGEDKIVRIAAVRVLADNGNLFRRLAITRTLNA